MKFDKIIITSTTTSFEVVCEDFRILDGLDITHKKTHSVVEQKNSTATSEIDTFTNQPFDIEIYDGLEKFTRLQNEIEVFDAEFVITIVVGGSQLLFYAKVTKHNMDNFNNSGLYSYKINFVRTTLFIRSKNYVVDVEQDNNQEQEPYDYTYDFPYPGDKASYTDSTKTVINKGVKDAAVQIVFYDESLEGPQVGVNDYADQVFNSYLSNGVNMLDGDTLTNSALRIPIIQKKTASGIVTNQAQNRIFLNSRGYIYLPRGTSVLFFRYTKKAVITVYELYENVRGALL